MRKLFVVIGVFLFISCEEDEAFVFNEERLECLIIYTNIDGDEINYSWDGVAKTWSTDEYDYYRTYNDWGRTTYHSTISKDSSDIWELWIEHLDEWRVSKQTINDNGDTSIAVHEWIGLIETYDDWSTTNHVIRSYNEFGYILSSMVYDNNGDFLDGFEYVREDDWRIVLEKSYTSENEFDEIIHHWNDNVETWDDGYSEYEKEYNDNRKYEKITTTNKETGEVSVRTFEWDCSIFEPILAFTSGSY